ncbi:MAG: PspC domain-containing protein [Bacteroidetes bacterium]|nr:MAG: PspC domain-containing protein [Bacteroidota bacterium]
MATKGLTRSKTDRWIAGVCGGIARRFDLDSTMVRMAYVLVSLLSAAFPGTLVYILLWILIPEED